ncbi:MAG: ion transporter, partial [Phaeodactylibacter sp.]|nr:ion transporter [Phaeodactylibacter sp.]
MLKRFFLSERNMMVAIGINAFLIFLIYFPQLEKYRWLVLLDHFFVLLFVLEAIVKLSVLKPKGYFEDNWNRFDLTVVLLSLPSVAEAFYPFPNTSVLLILRLFRLVRLVRFIRFVPHLGSILKGLLRALKSSVFVLIALFFLNFLLALLTCHFYRDIAPEYFGDPLLSAYSVFQLFTIEGWNEIPATIARNTDNTLLIGVSRFYFVLVVLIGGVFGMSLANAIFVDEMTMDNT